MAILYPLSWCIDKLHSVAQLIILSINVLSGHTWTLHIFIKEMKYCASHILVQPIFRRYNFYFLSDQAQIPLDHFNVLDELWG